MGKIFALLGGYTA